MYWADKLVDEILIKYKDKVAAGEPLIIRDEKTASGRVHVGSLRGVAIHGVIAEILKERGIPHVFKFEINDFDPMDGMPIYLDKATFDPFMGKPLCNVPSPDSQAPNFAEFYGQEFADVIEEIGYDPEFYRASTLYKDGKFNDAIRQCLIHADKVREIYKRVSGGVKADNWLPVNVICENCGKVSTTKATVYDPESDMVEYACWDLDWTKGCGHKGKISPYDGRAKLPWKVEWAAKFKILGVNVEGGGKDHSTKGGAREIAEAISREVLDHEPPFNIPYEFFQIGGKKMSSSKGKGSSAREIADLLPPEMVRLLLLMKDPLRVIEFDPEGETVPVLFDSYDKFAVGFFSKNDDDYSRMFRLVHPESEREHIPERHLPRFSIVAFLAQMPHLDTEKEVEHVIGQPLTDEDKKELKKRMYYAELWVREYAPENYRYEMKEELPDAAKDFTDLQKSALSEILTFINEKTSEKSSNTGGGTDSAIDGQEMHTFLHDLKSRISIEPGQLFEAIYVSILGKKSGPKAGWFLSVIDIDWLKKRLGEASN
jgi:lysyl-tRNA synthetase class 1